MQDLVTHWIQGFRRVVKFSSLIVTLSKVIVTLSKGIDPPFKPWRTGRGGTGEVVGWWCLLVATLLHESKESLWACGLSTEQLIWRGRASPWVCPSTRSRSLPGEGAPLAHVEVHGHLSPGVGGCQAAERPHSHRAGMLDAAGRCAQAT